MLLILPARITFQKLCARAEHMLSQVQLLYRYQLQLENICSPLFDLFNQPSNTKDEHCFDHLLHTGTWGEKAKNQIQKSDFNM